MAVRVVGTDPVQVAYQNMNRLKLFAQMLPTTVAAGNVNEKIYGKWGSAPKADANSGTWDFVLVPGASDGTNLDGIINGHVRTEDLWLIGSAANLQVNVVEENRN